MKKSTYFLSIPLLVLALLTSCGQEQSMGLKKGDLDGDSTVGTTGREKEEDGTTGTADTKEDKSKDWTDAYNYAIKKEKSKGWAARMADLYDHQPGDIAKEEKHSIDIIFVVYEVAYDMTKFRKDIKKEEKKRLLWAYAYVISRHFKKKEDDFSRSVGDLYVSYGGKESVKDCIEEKEQDAPAPLGFMLM